MIELFFPQDGFNGLHIKFNLIVFGWREEGIFENVNFQIDFELYITFHSD